MTLHAIYFLRVFAKTYESIIEVIIDVKNLGQTQHISNLCFPEPLCLRPQLLIIVYKKYRDRHQLHV